MTDVAALVEQLSRPSSVLGKREVELAHCLSQLLRFYCRHSAERYVQNRREQPILLQYASDLTPLLTRERWHQECSQHRVTRTGRAAREFLVQRLFLSDLDGSRCCQLEVPLVLERKTAYYHFCACRRFLATPRELGHVGLAVGVHKYDGALHTALDKLHSEVADPVRRPRDRRRSQWTAVPAVAHEFV